MKTTAAGLSSVLLAVMASAAPAEDEHPGQACTRIADPGARLACYDAAFAGPGDVGTAASAPSAAPTPPPEEAQRSSRTGLEDFGLSEAQRQAREGDAADEKAAHSLEATIVKVASRPRGEFIVTLDNGQVWVQYEADRRARVREGDVITIRKAALGSYLLVTPGRVATRVRRVE